MENPNGVVSGNDQNTPSVSVPRTFSTFDLKYHFMDTHRFGEYHPHYVEEGVKNDKLPIRSSHNVMSYTLKSPLMQNITMYKDYFNVPMEAILPLNWEKFFDNPVRGDDVSNDVGPSVENFWSKLGTLFSYLFTSVTNTLANSSTSETTALQSVLKFLVLGEFFYSNGSLLTSLGCHGAPYLNAYDQATGNSSFDKYFDLMANAIETELSNNSASFTFTVDGYVYTVYTKSEVKDHLGAISLRHALSLMRDNLAFTIQSVTNSPSFRTSLKSVNDNWSFTPVLGQVPLNLSRLFAYQLVCSHYYSNDHIDFVYSAELYRQLIGNYLQRLIGNSNFGSAAFFTRNSVRYQYDYLSAYFCSYMLTYVTSTTVATNLLTTSSAAVNAWLGYFNAVFGFRRSLRYLDYFTGSRAQPLAVGSTGVTVSGGSVDVVDITRNIQRQRFLNAVNRVRHSFEGYLQGIFGGDVPAPDYHNPFFLASTSDSIYGQETENTGVNQMQDNIAITSNLRSNGSRYMLEIRCDRPSVIIGITHYDLPRVYSRSMERMFLHVDRFDMFNPFMQFIGDQPIYGQELGISPIANYLVSMSNFSYGLRHLEYKERFNQCAGGFVENLPGWCFIANDFRGNQSTINPDWIRSVPSEIDDFYVSLTGYSLGSYFHFIVDNYNDCTGERPMAFAPSIL